MVRKFIASLMLCGCGMHAAAADTRPEIIDPQFHSLQTVDPSDRLGYPIIELGNPQSKVLITFDELAHDNRYLRYRLIHCDSDWRPSAISDLEYVDGFNDGKIEDWAFSEHTLTPYVNYRLELPNAEVSPKLSGNYVVEIYDEQNPDEVLLRTRFMCMEPRVGVAMDATTATDVDHNDSHQQLAVALNLDGAHIDDPYNELRLVVIQNGRPDMRRVIDKPLRVSHGTAVYEHQKELIFPAGNEYRRFDTSNIRYPLMGVERYDYIEPYYHAALRADSPRTDTPYQYDRDQAGRYFVNELNADNPDINADYVMVHFRLNMPQQSEPVYLDGDMVLRARNVDSRMLWSPQLGAYVKSLLLKQGMYNYQYVGAPIEGDKYQTGNEYVALVYYRPYGARYERLVGAGSLNTTK